MFFFFSFLLSCVIKARSLDAFCKQYRLVADCANDAALLVGVLASRRFFLLSLVLQSLLRAVVGVAGAATRAAVVVHQARGGRGNVSDVASKDGSQVCTWEKDHWLCCLMFAQETLVNLVALVVGYFCIPVVISNNLTWPVFFVLTFIHM